MNEGKPHEHVEYEALPAAMALLDAVTEILEGSGNSEIDDMRDRLTEERNMLNDWRLAYLGGKFRVADII